MAESLPSIRDDAIVAEAVEYAIKFHQLGRLAEAEEFYVTILKARPDHFDALHLLGILRQQQGDNAEALRLLGAALRTNRRSADALCNFGAALNALNRHDEALAAYDQALIINADHFETHNNRGNTFLHLDRDAEALAAFDKALAVKSGHVEALVNRATALLRLNRFQEALDTCDLVLERQPDHAAAVGNRASALTHLDRHEEALRIYRKQLDSAPDDVSTLNNYASVLLPLRRPEEALAAFDRSLAIAPDQPGVAVHRAGLLQVVGRHDEAVTAYDKILAASPRDAEALYNRAKSLWSLDKLEEAIESYAQAWELNHPRALSELAMCRLRIADWARVDTLLEPLRTLVAEGNFVDPFVPMAFRFHPADHLKVARSYIQTVLPAAPTRFAHTTPLPCDKLRIAYLSSDFRAHPVGFAIVDLLERHDKTRFETTGISFGLDDASTIRSRIAGSFDRFHNVGAGSDQDVAKLLNDLQVHIAVDLNGLTRGFRPGVLARRPAPIQVSYLGYAGTTGAEFYDYILADETVLPFEQQPFFAEKIVQLPGCYHANDTTRQISPQTPTRRELELPDNGFVFCCFNQSYKITAPIFDVWMRLLAYVPGSVLWLSPWNDLARANLRHEAAARGVDPDRLIFAARMDSALDHLARHRAADLFLDTLPYNAHSTTCDALWAGLPVLTCAGDTFAGRVAASMVKAAGLPELVTQSLEDYEALALKLATSPAQLSSVRRKLADNRSTCPLFDGDLFRRHVEAAYTAMWDIHRRGESPRGFRVEPCA
jgi:protein O-GlcNAc transferase